MNADVSKDLNDLETRWRVREREWARRLGRLRLGVEPLEEQLDPLPADDLGAGDRARASSRSCS